MTILSRHLQVLAVVERVSPRIRAQLVMFTYYNPIMRRGAERFCQQAKAAGASGATQPHSWGDHVEVCDAPCPILGAALSSMHELQGGAQCASEHAQQLPCPLSR